MKRTLLFVCLSLVGCQPKDANSARLLFFDAVNKHALKCDALSETVPHLTAQKTWEAKWICISQSPRILWISTDEFGRVDVQVESTNTYPAGNIEIIE